MFWAGAWHRWSSQGRHSPGVPGDSCWGWMEGGITACRSCVLVESLSSHQEKSCGSRSADCGVAEMIPSCPDLLQNFAGTRAWTFSCTEGDTGTVWVCLVGKWGLSQWPRLEASVLSIMTLGPKHAEEMGWQSIGSHSWEVMQWWETSACPIPPQTPQKRCDKLEWMPHRPMTLMKGQWGICHMVWDWEAELFSLEKGMLMGEVLPKYLMGSKADKAKLILVGSVRGKEAKGKKLKCRKFHLKARKGILLWEWLSTRASGPERLGSLHPWRLKWTWAWETHCSWPCFEQGGWTRWSPELPSSLSCLEENSLAKHPRAVENAETPAYSPTEDSRLDRAQENRTTHLSSILEKGL